MKEMMDPVFATREINRNLYKGFIAVDENYEWDYSLVDPQVFPIVRNYLSRSNAAGMRIRLDARKPEDMEKRKINQEYINWELGEIALTSLAYRMAFSAYICGRGYLKTGWKFEKAIKIQKKDPKTGAIVFDRIIRDVVNRADAKFVRYNDILVPNRNCPVLQEQPYFVELIQMRVGEMIDENDRAKEYGDKLYWDEKWLKKLKTSGVSMKLLDYQVDMATDTDNLEDLAFKSAYVPLMCMQTLDNDMYYMPIDNSDDTIVNVDHTGKYWHGHYPIIDFCPFPEDDEYCNLALVDVIGDLQIASTEVLNQTLTNIRQINNDMWIAGTSAAQTPDWMFQKRPSGIIRVAGDTTQIQQVRTQDNTMSALRMGQELQNKGEKASGISSLYSSGAPSQGINQTARGAQIIDQNIDTNMKMIMDLWAAQVVKPLGEHFMELNAQFVTDDQLFNITGRKNVSDMVKIPADKISANFIVSSNGEMITKQTPASRQVNLQNFMTTMTNVQHSAGVQVDIVPIAEALVDSYPEMDNVEDVIVSVDDKAERDISYLERGQMPDIKVRDDHNSLIAVVNVHYAENEATYPEPIKQVFTLYVQKHLKYIEAQKQIAAMTAPVMPHPNESINFKDVPPSVQPQMLAQAGLKMTTPAATDPNNQAGTPNQTYQLGNVIQPAGGQ